MAAVTQAHSGTSIVSSLTALGHSLSSESSGSLIRVVLIEDNDVDAAFITRQLTKTLGGSLEITRCVSINEALLVMVSAPPDLIITDLSLPDAEGIEAVKQARGAGGATPIIVLTGKDDEEVALRALSEGAQDYLVKGKIDSDTLVRAVRYSLARSGAAAELRHTAAELERSNEELEQYASMVAHDLRAPVRTARLLANRLVSSLPEEAPNKTEDLSERLDSALDRLDETIRGLLDYATIRDSDVATAKVELGDLVSIVVSDLQADIGGVSISVENGGGPIEGDPKLLEHLLQNLIENSLKYRSNERDLAITISHRELETLHEIRVTDNGRGVPSEYRAQIFEMFRRLAKRSEVEGVGIGLAMCRRIVARHGGTIWIEDSPDGLGVTFCFTLEVHKLEPVLV